MGPRKIAFALSAKGIAPDVVKAALEEVDEGESARRMREVVEVKWRSVKVATPFERRQKVLRFALSRGYDYERVSEVLDSLEE